jgi:hypothetical protein
MMKVVGWLFCFLVAACFLPKLEGSVYAQNVTVQWESRKEKVFSPQKERWIFLLAGQSNMAGRGIPEGDDTISHPRVFVLNQQDEWVLAKEPLHYDKKGRGTGPGLAFAKAMASAFPHVEILLVPTAVGGTKIEWWLPSHAKGLFEQSIKKAKTALSSGVLKGMLWQQGESDANTVDAPKYEARLSLLLQAFRKELNAPQLPIVVGGLADFLQKPQAPIVVNAIQAVVEKSPPAAFSEPSALGHIGDHLHYNSAAQRENGVRMAIKMIDLLKRKGTNGNKQSLRNNSKRNNSKRNNSKRNNKTNYKINKTSTTQIHFSLNNTPVEMAQDFKLQTTIEQCSFWVKSSDGLPAFVVVSGTGTISDSTKKKIDDWRKSGADLWVENKKAWQAETRTILGTPKPIAVEDLITDSLVYPRRRIPAASYDRATLHWNQTYAGKNNVYRLFTTKRGMSDWMLKLPISTATTDGLAFSLKTNFWVQLVALEITDRFGNEWISWVKTDTTWKKHILLWEDFFPVEHKLLDKKLQYADIASCRIGINTMVIWREHPMDIALADFEWIQVPEHQKKAHPDLAAFQVPFLECNVDYPEWLQDPVALLERRFTWYPGTLMGTDHKSSYFHLKIAQGSWFHEPLPGFRFAGGSYQGTSLYVGNPMVDQQKMLKQLYLLKYSSFQVFSVTPVMGNGRTIQVHEPTLLPKIKMPVGSGTSTNVKLDSAWQSGVGLLDKAPKDSSLYLLLAVQAPNSGDTVIQIGYRIRGRGQNQQNRLKDFSAAEQSEQDEHSHQGTWRVNIPGWKNGQISGQITSQNSSRNNSLKTEGFYEKQQGEAERGLVPVWVKIPEGMGEFPLPNMEIEIDFNGRNVWKEKIDLSASLFQALQHLVKTQDWFPDGRISNHYFGDAYGVRAMLVAAHHWKQAGASRPEGWTEAWNNRFQKAGERFVQMLIDKQDAQGGFPMGYSEHTGGRNVADGGQIALAVAEVIPYLPEKMKSDAEQLVKRFLAWTEAYYISPALSDSLQKWYPEAAAKGDARAGMIGLGSSYRSITPTGPLWVLSDVLAVQVWASIQHPEWRIVPSFSMLDTLQNSAVGRIGKGEIKQPTTGKLSEKKNLAGLQGVMIQEIAKRNAAFYVSTQHSSEGYFQAEALAWAAQLPLGEEMKKSIQENLRRHFISSLFMADPLDMYTKGGRSVLKGLPLLYYQKMYGNEPLLRKLQWMYLWNWSAENHPYSVQNMAALFPHPMHGESITASKFASFGALWAAEWLFNGATGISERMR